MSGTSSPVSSSTPLPTTRTLAIIKPHALKHRFEVEARISASGFEIIKERQMGFMHGDSSVEALFGHDADSICGEPVWVYVLERSRAVEVWNALMGDPEPDVAREITPGSLRALFGVTMSENAVYGSPDVDTAELQIASLFISSPLFPPAEHDDDVPEDLLPPAFAEEEMDNDRSPKVDIKSKRTGFKARPIPTTTHQPSIQPRTTRAAALRAGKDLPAQKPRQTATAESIAQTFANVPGHKRAMTIAVSSTAAPTIAPRATRASALRTGQITPPKTKARPSTAREPTSPERLKEIFADVPGHKRRQSILVASTAPPAISPRPTRASALRTGQPLPQVSGPSREKSTGPQRSPSPTDIRRSNSGQENEGVPHNTFDGVPGHKRAITVVVPAVRPPSTPPKTNRSAILRQQKRDSISSGPPSSWGPRREAPGNTPQRPASQSSMRVTSSNTASLSARSTARSASVEPEQIRATPASRPRAPSITPRSNKSALLRAKMQPSKSTTSVAPRVAAF